ncbi:MAG TPA: aldose epimerase family protein [Bacillales bacterium]|nr:aldose epimerase family protein [Bacillales bacterium]
MEVFQRKFGEVDGKNVTLFTVKNDNGMEVSFIDYGCIITKIVQPDASGNLQNVVLGFDSMEEYLQFSPYFGAVVGRVAGRIRRGTFELDGKRFTLAKNENEKNHLHGGKKGFSDVVWDAEIVENEKEAGAILRYTSGDGEEGYPGMLALKVTYLLTDANEWVVTYEGKTDEATLLNMTNHTYFNLSGDLQRDVLDHTLKLPSEKFLEIDEELLPTGRELDVEGTAFDFREARPLRNGANSAHPQNKLAGGGFDHPFMIETRKPIVLTDETSGRQLTVTTDQPCVVVYSGNQLDDSFDIRGTRARKHLGVCLETQKPPDAIHHPEWSSVVLRENETYRAKTTFSFSVVK